jgi:glucosylceramidase
MIRLNRHHFSLRGRRGTLGLLLLAVVLFSNHRPASGQTIALTVSSKAGDRLTDKPPLTFGSGAAPAGPAFRIDESVRHQTIVGFGASLLEAGLVCINSLSSDQQEAVLRKVFDPKEGAGFSAMKTVLAGTDFMSGGPWYTYDTTPGDVEMRHFTIERDLGPTGLVTFIRRARKHGSFVLQAPMDYPPDWMLVEVDNRAKQNVDPKYYDALTLYYLRYLQEYAKQGIVIDYLSLFNEPGVYSKIPYENIRDLLKNHVGPRFAKEGVTTKIMLSEACTRADAHRLYPTLLDDPEARKYVAALPYHGYDLKNFDKIAALHARYPDLPLWMTEICHFRMNVPKVDNLPRHDFEDGDFWGNQILSDVEAGASAWIYWNLVLDEKGGPCLVSPVHGNPEFNIQHPVVIVNRQTKEVTYTGCYYYLAHFSKFVRPGAVCVETTGSIPGVRCIAFAAPNKSLVAQLLNRSGKEVDARLAWHDRSVRVSLPPLSITTCRWTTDRATREIFPR